MAVGGVAADVVADGSGFGASLRRVLARYRNESVDVAVNVDTRRASQQLGAVERRLRSLRSAAASAARVSAIATAISFLGAASAVAAGQIVAVTAALAPMVGILAGLPAAFGVAIAGVATLVVALQGVGDAFTAALGNDAAAFEEALAGLAPAAAETARALREVAPAWRTLQGAVQDALFAGLADDLRDVSSTLVGPLQAGMTSAATSLNGLVRGFADVITSAQGIEFIEGTFATLSTLIDNTSEPLNNLVAAFIAVGNAINTAFGADAGSGLADLIQRFAGFLNAAAESGDAVAWVNNAIDVFGQLGAILAPIGGILASIGAAASGAGGSILGAFGTALQALDDFLASAEGTAFLGELFGALSELGGALGPVFSALGSALTPLLATAGELVTILGPGLTTMINALGDGLAIAAPSLLVLGDAVVALVEAAAPLLPVLGEWLASIIELGATILTGLTPAIDVIVGLIEVFAPIVPAFIELADILLQSMIPAWEQWADSAMLLLPPMAELVTTLVTGLMPIAQELLPLIGELASTFADEFGQALIDAMPTILQLTEAIIQLAEFALPIAVQGATVVASVLSGLISVVGTLIGWILDLVGWFVELGGVAFNVGAAIGSAVRGIYESVANWFGRVKTWIDNIVSWFVDLPGRILGAIGNLGEQIWSAITSGIGDLGDFIGFANGGIITSPTVAALAEDGRPEVVIPLTKPARAQQLAQESGLTQILNVGSSEPRSPVNVTINVQGGDLREVRRTIEDVMAEYA
jgi:phage-related protein